MMEEKEVFMKKKQLTMAYQLQPGMVVAEDLYSQMDQLLCQKDTILTQKLIAKIIFFGIEKVQIYLDGLIECNNFTEQLKRSQDYTDFVHRYDRSLSDVKSSMTNLIESNIEIDADRLVDEVELIVKGNMNNIQIFQMIHCIRDYDDETFIHSINVSLICDVFADWLRLNAEEKKLLILGGLLHDIGKLLVPKEVLTKPSRLTQQEFAIMKRHPIQGYDFLLKKKVPERVRQMVVSHHERYDGKGYPYAKKGKEIEPFAVIISIADVYEAMTSRRVYRDSLCPFEVIRLFEEEGFSRFDAEYLVPLMEKITETYIHHTVQLSNGIYGEIILIHKNALSRPLINVEGNMYDLESHHEVYITKVL